MGLLFTPLGTPYPSLAGLFSSTDLSPSLLLVLTPQKILALWTPRLQGLPNSFPSDPLRDVLWGRTGESFGMVPLV